MSEDLISRQAAIAEIKDYIVDPDKAVSEYEDNVFNYNAGLKSAVQAVVDLPSAQPESRLIPIEERPPELDKRVLIRNDEGLYLVGFIKSWKWGNEWSYQLNMHDYDAYDEQEQGRIVAWMPLPE